MSENDIRPHTTPHGGTNTTKSFALGTAVAFNLGEPVRLDQANGNVIGCTTIPAAFDFLGIAASPGDTTSTTRLTFRQKLGSFTPGSGVPVAGGLVQVWLNESSQFWITGNVGTASGDIG